MNLETSVEQQRHEVTKEIGSDTRINREIFAHLCVESQSSAVFRGG